MQVLHQFHRIVSDQNTTQTEKVNHLLQLGLKLFGLDIGIVSRVDQSAYLVEYVQDNSNSLSIGAEFCVDETYCFFTLNQNKTTGFNHAGQTDIAKHPCYLNLKLEAYIGAPIFVDGEVYGTVNFSASLPRKPFSQVDFDYIELFSQWMGLELSRAKTLKELRTNDITLKKLEKSANIGTWEVDMLKNTVSWSDQTKVIHAVSPDYQPQLDTAINFYKEGYSRTTIEKLVAESIETGKSFQAELTLISALGEEVRIATFGEAEFNDHGCVRLFGVIQDITESYEQRQAIDQAHKRMKLATDSGQIGIWQFNITDNSLIWDEQMYRLYGLDPNDKTETYEIWANQLHVEDKEKAEKAVEDALSGEGEFDTEFRIKWPDGSTHYIRGTAIVERDESAKPLAMVGINWDVTQERLLTEKVSHQASHDSLTGLKNRAEFERQLQHTLDTRTSDKYDVMMFVDLDRFKIINDTCGHAAGDLALKSVGNLIGTFIRTDDTLARLGGDEFGLILKRCDIGNARKIAQKICDAMADFRFVFEGKHFRLGSSIGLVAVYSHWNSVSEVMQAADRSCYGAKESGRNCVYEYSESDKLIEARKGEIDWASKIEQALEDDRFMLFAQQIKGYEEDTNKLHAEVLIRMQSPDGEIISPGVFLPAAERYQIVSKIDQHVLTKAVSWLNSLDDTQFSRLDMLSINLSGQSVENESFKTFCLEFLSEQPTDLRNKLCLEITETVAITNITAVSQLVSKIRSLGINVALDDFGAGSATFSYLKNLEIDILKIDGQFIKDILVDNLDEIAVKSFVEIAKAKKLRTVAEWVENQETLDRLQDLSVDFCQGFYLHKPEPLEALFRSYE